MKDGSRGRRRRHSGAPAGAWRLSLPGALDLLGTAVSGAGRCWSNVEAGAECKVAKARYVAVYFANLCNLCVRTDGVMRVYV